MDLHRAGKRTEWAAVPPDQRNGWQQLAARTHGIATPGNMVSIAGAALVAVGLTYIYQGEMARGLAFLLTGRLADIADGMVAARTRTKSLIGEAVDATIDKLTMLAAIAVFIVSGVVPALVVALFIVLNAASALLGVVSKIRKRTLHPSWAGKLSTGFQWGAFMLYVGAELLHSEELFGAELVVLAAGLLVILSLATGAAAVQGYAAEALRAGTKTGHRA
jgi:phosphatidylglycerophosphate synthase